jgi:hypothetical protein
MTVARAPVEAIHPAQDLMAPSDAHDAEWLGRWDEY